MAENQQNQKGNQPEQDLNQLLKVRREKLAALQEAGKDPFVITKYDQTHHSDEAKALYEAHEAELLKDRAPFDESGLDEEALRAAKKEYYNETRAIMDAQPIAEDITETLKAIDGVIAVRVIK